MAPKCSIVIRAYNEEKHIGRLLSGISQQTLTDIETILVDSGSTDSTRDIASKYPVKVMHITPANFTFGRSLNTGIAAANAEFIVIISAHCYPVYPDWLEQLIKPFQDPQVGLCYGKQRGGDTNCYSEHQWFQKYFPESSLARQGHPFSHNANAAIRRSLWQMHPYDENLTGLEDLAWSSWAFEQGHAIAYTAEAEIIHQHQEGPRKVFNRYRREAIAMSRILPRSRFGLWRFLRLWSSSSLSDILQARREGVLGKHLVSILWFRLTQYWGTYSGYHYRGRIDSQLHQQFYYPPGVLSSKTQAARQISPIEYEKSSD